MTEAMDHPNLDDLMSAFERAPFLAKLSRALAGSGVFDADDLVQDAWVAALERPPKHGVSLGGWFARVMQNRAHDLRAVSRRRVERERERAAARPEAQGDGPVLDELELQRQILDHVLALDERYREAIHLRFYRGLGPTEIARQLGLPVKTVKTRLSRALEELRERLDRDADGDRSIWLSALLPLVDLGPRPVSMLPILGKAIPMKKAVASLVALVLLGIGIQVVFDPLRPAEAAPDRTSSVALVDAEEGQQSLAGEPANLKPAGSAQREAIEPPLVEADELGSLLVEFRDELGEPLVDIGVGVRARPGGLDRDQMLLARTDAAGAVRFEGLAPRFVYVSNDRGTASDRVEIEAGAETVLRLVAGAGATLEVFVVNVNGLAVPGAEIWCEPSSTRWPTFRFLGRVDAGGRAVFEGLDQRAHLGAHAPGHQASPVVAVRDTKSTASGRRTVELVMGDPGGALAGRVVDPDGRPVVGAAVLAGWSGGGVRTLPSGVSAVQADPIRVLTDANGRFEMPGDLPEGRVPVWVDASGWPAWSGSVQSTLGQRAELLVELGPGATVEGRVVDSGGEPVVGGGVIVGEEYDGGWYSSIVAMPSARTDEEGRFRITGVAVGPQELNASAPRKERTRGKAQRGFNAKAGQTVELELTLNPGLVITGRVVDLAGQPVPEWGVDSRFQFPAQQSYPRQAKTDRDGLFTLVNLGEGRHTLSFRPAEFYGEAWAVVRDVEAGTVDLEIVVDAAAPDAFITGVIGNGGQPIPSRAALTLWREHGRSGYFVDLDPATGRFEHGPIAAGRYVLSLTAGEASLIREKTFEVKAGERLDLGVLPVVGSGAIEVVLAGEPLDEKWPLFLGLTPEVGVFGGKGLDPEHLTVEGLMEGRWLLRSQSEPYFIAPQWIDVRAGETTRVECKLAIAPERSVNCRFESKDSEWQSLKVEITDEAGELVFLEPALLASEALGRRLSLHRLCLPDGKYTVTAETDSGLFGELELVFGAGGKARYTVDVRD